MKRFLKFLGALVGGLIVILVVIALINPGPADPADVARRVFGTPGGDRSSGLAEVTVSGNEVTLHYRLFALGAKPFEEELGIDLAPKLRRFFREAEGMRYATVLVLAPYESQGGITWLPKLSFRIAAQSLADAGSNFLDSQLLTLAYGVERFR